jgi:hypothetical protein
LTIIALLAIGFLMLGESTWLITLSVNSFKLHEIFPLFIIFSTIIIRSYKGIFGKVFGLILFLWVFWGVFSIGIYTSLNPSSKRKSGNTSNYTMINTGQTNLYLETLIGNSYIEWTKTDTGTENNIQSVRNSDRNLLVTTWSTDIRFNEDNNRNILQNYTSRINLTIPNRTIFDMIYIKNLLWIHTIDLHTIQRKKLTFHAGIDIIIIRIGNVLSGNTIEIQGPVGNIELNIPKDIGVNMYYKNFVGKIEAPEFYTLSGNYFQSNNIATAKAMLNIYINLWAGNTKINRVDGK